MAHRRVRRSALWYPDIPDESLDVNEASFTGPSPSALNYRPMIWINLGGVKGDRLRHVTGILIQGGYSDINSLMITFDNGTETKLGERATGDRPDQPFFTIDGARGERIESVSIGTRRDLGFTLNGFDPDQHLSAITVSVI